MRLLFSLFFVLLCSIGSFGQLSLKGRIAADDKKPIPSGNVLLMNAGDSTLIKGCIVNDSGEYKMDKIAPGKYYLSYTAIGFRTCRSPLFELTSSEEIKDFGTTIMPGEPRQLQEIVIRAEKPVFQMEMNRTVINVQNSIFTKGSSILEVLARSPGVVVDHHNNSIILNGKNGVGIMINGKLVRLPPTEIYNMLDGMSANNIEKIELLPVPPAKYDAEGTAGMINIILKKNEEHGTNGSYSRLAASGCTPNQWPI